MNHYQHIPCFYNLVRSSPRTSYDERKFMLQFHDRLLYISLLMAMQVSEHVKMYTTCAHINLTFEFVVHFWHISHVAIMPKDSWEAHLIALHFSHLILRALKSGGLEREARDQNTKKANSRLGFNQNFWNLRTDRVVHHV